MNSIFTHNSKYIKYNFGTIWLKNLLIKKKIIIFEIWKKILLIKICLVKLIYT